jgi:ribosome-binding factor A
MAAPHFHKERLSHLLQREIASVIARELRDPRIPPVVTVSAVNLSTDLRNATVYVSVLGEEENAAELSQALNKAAPWIQRLVAGRVTMKHFPRLCFKYDRSMVQAEKINRLLEEIKNEPE